MVSYLQGEAPRQHTQSSRRAGRRTRRLPRALRSSAAGARRLPAATRRGQSGLARESFGKKDSFHCDGPSVHGATCHLQRLGRLTVSLTVSFPEAVNGKSYNLRAIPASESEKINNPATISHNHVWPWKIGARRLSQTCKLRNFGTVP